MNVCPACKHVDLRLFRFCPKCGLRVDVFDEMPPDDDGSVGIFRSLFQRTKKRPPNDAEAPPGGWMSITNY